MPSTSFARFPDGVMVVGDLVVGGTFTIPNAAITDAMVSSTAEISRSKLAMESLKSFPVKLTDLRIFDAFQTNLPGSATSDDLGLVGGTHGTNTPMIKTSDSKATSVTQRARFLVQLPVEYQADDDVQIRFKAGMQTTVSDGTATIDIEVYESNKEGGVSSDLCSTAAQSINSLTFANKDFVLTDTALAPGDWLDIRVTIAITDSATATAVIGAIGSIELLCDVRG